MSPRKFGKYEVLARLATGGAANIFLARQPGAAGFHKLVCLKALLPERVTDSDFVAMFLDEARLAARLNHPNCVQIYDLGRVRGSYYISMEYIFGETLWNLLATVTKLRTSLPTAHVSAILANVCDGLHHAHELKDSNGRPYNLVHRDVSPQNIMITFEGQTKVVDFGIAKAETGRAPTVAGIVKGKFSYMSPEQITGGSIDRRSDVYSLGIVLFECLASRRLYRGDSPEDIARLILEHRAPRLKDVVPDIPPGLDQICAIALSRHPSKRYQTAQSMGDALRDHLDSIRYTHSAGAISRLIEDRFKGQIAERRKIFESALNGTYDEGHLLKVLDARAVRDIDLFPEEDSVAQDFVEPTDRPTPVDDSAGVRQISEEETGEIVPSGADFGPAPAASHPPLEPTRIASDRVSGAGHGVGLGWRIPIGEEAPSPFALRSAGAEDDYPEAWDDDDDLRDTTGSEVEEIERLSDRPPLVLPGKEERGVDQDSEPAARETPRLDAPTGIDFEAERAGIDGTAEIDARRDPVTYVEMAPEGSQSITALGGSRDASEIDSTLSPAEVSKRSQKAEIPRRASAVSVEIAHEHKKPTITRSPGQEAGPDFAGTSEHTRWGQDTSPHDFGEETSVEANIEQHHDRTPQRAVPVVRELSSTGPLTGPLADPAKGSLPIPAANDTIADLDAIGDEDGGDFDKTVEQHITEAPATIGISAMPAHARVGDKTTPDIASFVSPLLPRMRTNGTANDNTVPLDKNAMAQLLKEPPDTILQPSRQVVPSEPAIEKTPPPAAVAEVPHAPVPLARQKTFIDARFGTPAIIAAFAVGLGLGLILGLLVAQAFSVGLSPASPSSPVPQVTPRQTESR